MKKLSADTLMKFNTDIISVLSPDRLESYEGNIEQYYENRLLALQAGHKIAELEIFLRNKLDFCLKNLVGEDWIKTPKSLEIIKLKDHTSIEELTPSQMLSKLMLGEVIALINTYKVEHFMIDLRSMDFKKYHWRNNDYFKINGRKNFFSNVAKVEIILNLIRDIRNRCFHWENLLKTRTIKGKAYPRLVTIYPKNQIRENQTIIGIMPEMILEFLDDLLRSINNPTIQKFQDIEMKYGGK